MAESAFSSWAAHVVKAVKVRRWARKLRMATDCSGLGAPEEAWSMLVQAAGWPTAECVFACDIAPASRRWLELHAKPNHIFADITLRAFAVDQVLATDLSGQHIKLTRDDAKLDLYVAGFMCTPFSDKGKRLGWQAGGGGLKVSAGCCSAARGLGPGVGAWGCEDEAAKTFCNCVRTIKALRPRVAVLENVMGLEKSGCLVQAKKMLERIPGYCVAVLKVNTASFGLPQHRPRIYIVLTQKQELPVDPDKWQVRLLDAVTRCKHPATMPFHKWLAHAGVPLTGSAGSAAGSAESAASAGPCTCGVRRSCPTHLCQCQACRKTNPSKKLCKWRQELRVFMARPQERKRVKEYLAKWKSVRKDHTVKHAPVYFELAATRKLRDRVTSPRERCTLNVLSRGRNLHAANAILDLSQSISRACFRVDGLVPTLGTGGGIFVPSTGERLSPQHCLALQGIDPASHELDGFTREQLYRLAGNAMSVPVVGAVMWSAMSMLANA